MKRFAQILKVITFLTLPVHGLTIQKDSCKESIKSPDNKSVISINIDINVDK